MGVPSRLLMLTDASSWLRSIVKKHRVYGVATQACSSSSQPLSTVAF
jgi:hypothetical protein